MDPISQHNGIDFDKFSDRSYGILDSPSYLLPDDQFDASTDEASSPATHGSHDVPSTAAPASPNREASAAVFQNLPKPTEVQQEVEDEQDELELTRDKLVFEKQGLGLRLRKAGVQYVPTTAIEPYETTDETDDDDLLQAKLERNITGSRIKDREIRRLRTTANIPVELTPELMFLRIGQIDIEIANVDIRFVLLKRRLTSAVESQKAAQGYPQSSLVIQHPEVTPNRPAEQHSRVAAPHNDSQASFAIPQNAAWHDKQPFGPGVHGGQSANVASIITQTSNSLSHLPSSATAPSIHEAAALDQERWTVATIESNRQVRPPVSPSATHHSDSTTAVLVPKKRKKQDYPQGIPSTRLVIWQSEKPDNGPDESLSLEPQKRVMNQEQKDNRSVVYSEGACVRCRRLKIKCSGGIPCAPCLKYFSRDPTRSKNRRRRFPDCVRKIDHQTIPADLGASGPPTRAQAFNLFFFDLFGPGGLPLDLATLERLENLYIECLICAFPKQTVVARTALNSSLRGVSIFIKANTVLMLKRLLPDSLAVSIQKILYLRAFASNLACRIFADLARPGTIRSASPALLVDIIVVLALFTEQLLDSVAHRDQRQSDNDVEERQSQDQQATQLLGYLRFVVLTAFGPDSDLLRTLYPDEQRDILTHVFWETLGMERKRLLGRGNHGPLPPSYQSRHRKDMSTATNSSSAIVPVNPNESSTSSQAFQSTTSYGGRPAPPVAMQLSHGGPYDTNETSLPYVATGGVRSSLAQKWDRSAVKHKIGMVKSSIKRHSTSIVQNLHKKTSNFINNRRPLPQIQLRKTPHIYTTETAAAVDAEEDWHGIALEQLAVNEEAPFASGAFGDLANWWSPSLSA